MKHHISREQGNVILIVLMVMIAVGIATMLLTSTNIIENRTARESILRSRIDAEARSSMQLAQQVASKIIGQAIRDEAMAIGNPAASTPIDLSAFEQGVQARLNAAICNQSYPGTQATSRVRIHVTGVACSRELPSSVTLGEAIHLRGETAVSTTHQGPGSMHEYRLPFVIVTETKMGEASRTNDVNTTQVQEGEAIFAYGNSGINFFAMFATDSDNSDPMDENLQVAGPVMFQGIPSLKDRPYFGSSFTATGIPEGGSENSTRYIDFQKPIGRIQVGDLRPSVNAPCYNADCPTFVSGSELAAPNWWTNFRTEDITANLIAQGRNVLVLPRTGDVPGDISNLKIWYGKKSQGDPTPADPGDVIDIDKTDELQGQYISYCDSGGNCKIVENDVAGNQFTDISVNGNITELSGADDYTPAISGGRQFGIVASGNINITGSLRVPDPACRTHMYVNLYNDDGTRKAVEDFNVEEAKCDESDKTSTSLLSVYAGRDITIGDPNGNSEDITIHAALAAPRGEINQLRNTPAGEYINVLGSMAFGKYKAFQRFGVQDYRLRFDYDPRFGFGHDMSPPGWPMIRGVPYVNIRLSPPRFTGR